MGFETITSQHLEPRRLPIHLGLWMFVIIVSVGGCGGPNADVESGPVILQCDGETTSTISHSRKPDQRVFRINGLTNTFEVWNEEEAKFHPWGTGTLKIDANSISYIGSSAGVRGVTISRTNGKITDEINALFGIIDFTGECTPVRSPEQRQKQF